MAEQGNSNVITRQYLDSLCIETRYMNSTNPSTSFTLYGETFSSPIMTAALSHIGSEMAVTWAQGAKDAGCVCWYGMADEEEIEKMAATGARLIEIIKPYSDRDLITEKIRHAEKLGLLAVGIDIDHPYAEDGSPDIVDGYEMKALTTEELRSICRDSSLPVIAKGVLSRYDAEEVLKAGAGGMVLSHHNNRITYALPPLKLLPEITALVPASVPVFADCMIQTGMDAFKALSLGATGVCIGRPLLTAGKKDPEQGIRDYLLHARDELAKAMAFTGTVDLAHMDASVIHSM